MKKNILFVLGLGFIFLNFSCTKTMKDNEFQINGTFENPQKGHYIYIKEITPTEIVTLDSVQLGSSGEYSFKREMSYPSLYMLFLTPYEFITICPKGKETIAVHADQKAFSATYTVTGSPESEKLWTLNKETLKGVADLGVLAKTWDNVKIEENKDKIRAELDSLYQACFREQKQYNLAFIEKNKGSLITLIAINKDFNRKNLFTPQNDFAVFEEVVKGLEQQLPGNPHTIQFSKDVKKMEALMVIEKANELQ